jgi:hypothetical protein
MRFRKLRIAWSVAWAVVAVLFCVLWVRSYWRCDLVFREKSGWVTTVSSNRGVLYATQLERPFRIGYRGWQIDSRHTNDDIPGGVGWAQTSTLMAAQLPIWCAILVLATTAAMPWLRWRFSLRTLLIATTLVAVVLGLIVWFSR